MTILLGFVLGHWHLYLIGAGIVAAVVVAFVFAPTLMALPLAREVAGGALVVAFGMLLYAHVVRVAYQQGYDAAVAAVKAETDAEVAKAQAVADYWQKWAQGADTQITDLRTSYAAVTAKVARLLADAQAVACLPSDIADQLRNVKGVRHAQ